ncbi:ABC transporter substrate-binding protein [Macrococcoides canis]|uniref:ABC transporter substrate-binding protein n=1 Tax=Macrococcoides canis TaxID=1855823 RepID=A0A4R6C1T6_9STAP|nr:ABC transporter substrate-binding protein [Macrococcus canis]MEE1108282.1 ABC transporter substrate-binding protein [Macrococcus canis]QIH75612.1 extracellular solute-binding protein [Macrococcus canis]QUR93753.1 extracellular solute-binding protein [Macrococcus canis]TDM15304.1 ABC transporter substrate-binding protein [Macrococcus canis]TDM20894.1 ABC transporter substrate-binding protein [Macrococcus canis]
MKQLLQLIFISLAVAVLLLFSSRFIDPPPSGGKGNVLYVYNWGEYIDPDLLKKFEKEKGIRVVLETFDSNEAMLAKIKNGGTSYDIAVPSEYAIQKMKNEKLLLPIDHNKIPNLKNINPDYMDLPFDKKNEYSIPYFWGTVGILYNPEATKGIDFSSWDSLWDKRLKNNVLIVDGAREALGLSLNSMGESLNETDPEKLHKAEQKLEKLAPNVKGVVADEINTMMVQKEADVAVVWSGMGADIMTENENLDFVVPKEGSNLWFDNIVIPKTAQNVEGAHEFINFLLDAQNAKQNTEWVGYATPNDAALKLLDKETREDERFYPSKEVQKKLEVYEDLGYENIKKYNELFLKFKMSLK